MKIFRTDIITETNSIIMEASLLEIWVSKKEKKSMLKEELLADP